MPVGVGGKPAAPPGGGGFKPGGAAPIKPVSPPIEAPAGAKKGGGGKKILLILIVVLLVLGLAGGGVALFFMLTGSKNQAETTQVVNAKDKELGTVALTSGEVLNINLSDGHFLAFGATAYFSADVKAESSGHGGGSEMDATPFRDAAISVFMGQEMETLCSPRGKLESQNKLLDALNALKIEPWHENVVMIKYSTFACQ